jgi:hypothetical protein
MVAGGEHCQLRAAIEVLVPSLIVGRSGVTSVGAWWPVSFAAMAALTVVALACAPGII